MRLGQMSRKLGISQGEIVRFLSGQNLSVEEGSNVKLDESRVRLLYARYAPEEVYPQKKVSNESPTPMVTNESTESALLSNETGEVAASEEADENTLIANPPPAALSAQPVVAVSPGQETVPAENSPTGEAEVIRAPKVELAGLKVIGKIELPSPKKKEVSESDTNVTPLETPESSSVGGEEAGSEKTTRMETTPRRDDARRPRDGRRSDDARGSRRRNDREQRSPKNPIALQREKEMKEELERRKAKEAEEKERRTRNYNKRVKHSPPTKAVRLIEEPVEQLDTAAMESEPRGWFGKLIRWLRT